jgi:hypothetical protein
MYCPKCGTLNDDNNFRCAACQAVIQQAPAPPPPPPPSQDDDPALRLILPIGVSGLAIVAGYLGLFSLLLLPAPLAILFGILALRDIKRNPKKHGKWRAIFGIVMGSIGTVFLILVIGSSIVDGRR